MSSETFCFKKGPQLLVRFAEGKVVLSMHEGEGLCCEGFSPPFLAWFEAYVGKKQLPLPQELLAGFTPFTLSVYQALVTIPFGQTRSYGDIAASMGRKRAFRAVGRACGKNPYPLLIPCHRVVGRQGLKGFSQGLEIKRLLLEFESGTSFASS